MPELTEDDRAKRVVAGDGTEVGIVDRVEDGTAYVDPAEGVADRVRMKLGWGGETKGTNPLRHDAVAEVTDEEIRLRSDYHGE